MEFRDWHWPSCLGGCGKPAPYGLAVCDACWKRKAAQKGSVDG